ncbi:MAG: hypothetical protein WC850_01865 [Candidatus Gracilibacteria bacterium]
MKKILVLFLILFTLVSKTYASEKNELNNKINYYENMIVETENLKENLRNQLQANIDKYRNSGLSSEYGVSMLEIDMNNSISEYDNDIRGYKREIINLESKINELEKEETELKIQQINYETNETLKSLKAKEEQIKLEYEEKTCGYKEGYIFKDGKCVEKANSTYFYLSEFNEDKNKVIVISYYDKKNYLLNLKYTSSLYKVENFIGKSIVINMGTDFSIDKYDKFILNNQDTTTDIVIDILSVEKVDNDYTLKTCENVYGSNSIELLNGKCGCKTGYIWNTSKTECVKNLLTSSLNTKPTKDYNLSISNKQNIDKIFNSIKLKVLFLPSDKQVEYYSTLSSKIDSILLKQTNNKNINILNYLNSLIKDEANRVGLFLK